MSTIRQGERFRIGEFEFIAAVRHADGECRALMVIDGERIEGVYFEFCHWQMVEKTGDAMTTKNKKSGVLGTADDAANRVARNHGELFD